MRDRNERERGREASRRADENVGDQSMRDQDVGDESVGDPDVGDTRLRDDASVAGTAGFDDESFGRPENIVGGPSDPGTARDPTRPLAEGANDPAVSDPPGDDSASAPGRDRKHGGWGDEGIAGGRAGGTGP